MSKIVVTGGLGYIGSHTVVALQEAGHKVVVVDNLSNSTISVLEGIVAITGQVPEFFNLDLRDKLDTQQFLRNHEDISGVIHFAASKAVGESVENPLLYYENNIVPLIYILKELSKRDDVNFVFSSSCSVYGEAKEMPITENALINLANSPYGNTKQIGESILQNTCNSHKNIKTIALRYFNPIGAHPSSKIGELPVGIPQNLVPYITQTASGVRDQLLVFGDDYPTKDGTCVRDYIHVVDVANAHIIALERLLKNENNTNFEVFNIGTGTGSSVLDVIKSFERVSSQKLNYKIVARRDGDVVAAYANTAKANAVLGWEAKLSLDDAMRSAWQWQQTLK